MEYAYGEHVVEDELERYALGRAENQDRIEEHLIVCSTCLDALEKLDCEIMLIKNALAIDVEAFADLALV